MKHGKLRHSQSQGAAERAANKDVENMLAVWMKDNNSTQWADGSPFIQFMKNRASHSGIIQDPYKAMLDMENRVGLSTSSLPPEVISTLD